MIRTYIELSRIIENLYTKDFDLVKSYLIEDDFAIGEKIKEICKISENDDYYFNDNKFEKSTEYLEHEKEELIEKLKKFSDFIKNKSRDKKDIDLSLKISSKVDEIIKKKTIPDLFRNTYKLVMFYASEKGLMNELDILDDSFYSCGLKRWCNEPEEDLMKTYTLLISIDNPLHLFDQFFNSISEKSKDDTVRALNVLNANLIKILKRHFYDILGGAK